MIRPDRVPARRYYDPDFYEMECELLWPRVWQMACRLEEIPRPGDFVEYENLGKSVVVVRVTADEVKAYHNACRHRGVQLLEDRGSMPEWLHLPVPRVVLGPGRRQHVPVPTRPFRRRQPWTRADLRLAECRVEYGGGCAFINFDDNAPPLRESIEPFATHARRLAGRSPTASSGG